MSAKFLLISGVVGGLVIFVWGFVTHSAIPQPMYEFKDAKAVTESVHANAPQNGVYMTRNGLFAVVAFLPDLGDKFKEDDFSTMLPYLIREFLSSVLVAMLLATAIVVVKANNARSAAGIAAFFALIAWLSQHVSMWNWYGFSPGFILLGALDLIGGWFLAALTIGALRRKFA